MMISLIVKLLRPGRSKTALVQLTRYVYPSANNSVYIKARGVWGHAPPGNFLEF